MDRPRTAPSLLWNKTGKEAFWAGFVFGTAYFFGTLYWIYHSITYYGGMPFAVSICLVLLLCCYLALFPAVFSVLFISSTEKPRCLRFSLRRCFGYA